MADQQAPFFLRPNEAVGDVVQQAMQAPIVAQTKPPTLLEQGVSALASQVAAGVPQVPVAAPESVVAQPSITEQIAQGYANVASGQPAQPEPIVAMPAEVRQAASVAPTPVEQEIANTAVRQQVAKDNAVASAEAQQQAQLKAFEAQADAQVAKEDEELRARDLSDLFKDETAGRQVGLALSILAGGIAQGMLKLNDNPAVKTLNDILDREFENRKIKAQSREAAKKRVLEEFDRMLKLKEAQSKDEERRLGMQKTRADIQKIYADLSKEQRDSALVSRISQQGQGLTVEEAQMAPDKIRTRLVQVGDKFYPALSESQAKLASERAVSASEALNALQGLESIAGKDWYNKLTPENMALAEQLQRVVVGKMRLELFGPGAFTDTEQRLAQKIVKNPTDLVNIIMNDTTRVSLQNLMSKVKFGVRAQMRQSGVQIPKSKSEAAVDNLIREARARHGKIITPAQAIEALKKQGAWDPTEF